MTTQRDIDQAIVQSLDQVRALEDAQARYIGTIPLGDLPATERRMIGEIRTRCRAARDYADLTISRMMQRLDPYGDAYQFQPAEPVDLTANGLIPRTSGFCVYSDAVTVQDIPANTTTAIQNEHLVVNETQKPSDVPTFYRDGRIRVCQGDAVAIRLQATVMPSDPNDIAATAVIGLSIDDTPIFPAMFQLNGYGNPITLAYSTTAYAGAKWDAIGAAAIITSDGPIRITYRSLLVTRLHKGRL